MPENIEIKASIESIPAWTERVAALATDGPFVLDQEDTFFWCPAGRLKLRQTGGETASLIWYQRADTSGPRASHYLMAPVTDPTGMRSLLEQAFGSRGTVIKRRVLYRVGRTRVHLDDVRGLGAWLELETVLQPGEDRTDGEREARALMDRLGIGPERLEPRPYVELLLERGVLPSAGPDSA